MAESVAEGWVPLIPQSPPGLNTVQETLNNDDCTVKTWKTSDSFVQDTYLQETQGGVYSRGRNYAVVQDIYQVGFKPCYISLLERFQAKSYIIVAINNGTKLWGLLASYQNSHPRRWEESEVRMMS